MSESKEGKIEIKITQSPDFKMVFATGVFGGLSPLDGRMLFYVDRTKPKVVDERLLRTDFVEREFQVEVHMSPQQFVSVYNWMKSNIDRLEQQGIILQRIEKPKKTTKKKELK
jgi:hypothetical protein